jgi:hypothetical protein
MTSALKAPVLKVPPSVVRLVCSVNISRGDLPTPEENKGREKYAGKVAEE